MKLVTEHSLKTPHLESSMSSDQIHPDKATTHGDHSDGQRAPPPAPPVVAGDPAEEYEDLLPAMAGRLGAAGLVSELRAGFRLLADPARGGITAESLRRGAASVLGVGSMTAEEAAAMVREGDRDGDGVLGEDEFCVLMVRLSPGMMEDAEQWLSIAIADELRSPPADTD